MSVRKLFARLVGATIAALSASAVQAQQGALVAPAVESLGAVAVEGGERFRMRSAVVGRDYVVDVVRIDAAGLVPVAAERLPVVFVTDGDVWTTIVPAMVRAAVQNGQLPPMIVVTIRYGFDLSPGALPVMLQSVTRRATDFTPVHDEAYLDGVRPFTQQIFGVPWPDVPLGRAADFLAFIDEELKPFIASRYPVDLENAALVGHSLGALFTLHVLFASPDSFARYIAISPPAQYGNEVLFEEETRLAAGVNKRLFMGIGALDAPPTVESAPRLDAQIRASARPELHYRYVRLEGETHESVFPAGLMTGLRWVFETPLPPYAVAADAP